MIARLVDHPALARCVYCGTMREPIIIAPTYYKDFKSPYLSIVWNRAAWALKDCAHLIFCGYSLADADMHVKYLVKQAQLNRPSSIEPLSIHLVNHHANKAPADTTEEVRKFSRFFGEEAVFDSGLSFEEFAEDPGVLLGRPRQ